ncbi:MAG: hypothetical protein Rhob2KO_27900 [Rhodopirellula baltica]
MHEVSVDWSDVCKTIENQTGTRADLKKKIARGFITGRQTTDKQATPQTRSFATERNANLVQDESLRRYLIPVYSQQHKAMPVELHFPSRNPIHESNDKTA